METGVVSKTSRKSQARPTCFMPFPYSLPTGTHITGQVVLLKTALEDVNPLYHFINNKDVEDGINDFAENNNLDLVIAIPKKHKLMGGLFKKSSTKQLVFESHVPVMCVH